MSSCETSTVCADCRTPIDPSQDTPDKRNACPNCGSTVRCHDFRMSLTAGDARLSMAFKSKAPGQKKAGFEARIGSSHSRGLGKLVDHHRLIDREHDRYYERVLDYESGEVIHETNEPLSEHRNHGTAKKK